jgi:hypothetical protein
MKSLTPTMDAIARFAADPVVRRADAKEALIRSCIGGALSSARAAADNFDRRMRNKHAEGGRSGMSKIARACNRRQLRHQQRQDKIAACLERGKKACEQRETMLAESMARIGK